MLCSFNDALNCRNSVERTVFVCSRDVIYGLVFSASLQPFAGTRDAAAHGICSHGHWGMNLTMCHSRARWHPTVKSLDMKGMRRAEETGEVDGLYKRKKKNLDKTQHPLLHGVFSCFCCCFFFVFVLLCCYNTVSSWSVLGLYLKPVTCHLWCTVRRWLTSRDREKVLGGLRCKNHGISGADKWGSS